MKKFIIPAAITAVLGAAAAAITTVIRRKKANI